MSWSLRQKSRFSPSGPVALFWTTALLMASAQWRPPIQVRPIGGLQPIKQKGPGACAAEPQPVEPIENQQALELLKNPDAGKKLEAAQDYIKDEDWVTATKILQELLELKENYHTKVERTQESPDPARKPSPGSAIKSEADRLIATLPKAGKEFYQVNYGPIATQMLKECQRRPATRGDAPPRSPVGFCTPRPASRRRNFWPPTISIMATTPSPRSATKSCSVAMVPTS